MYGISSTLITKLSIFFSFSISLSLLHLASISSTYLYPFYALRSEKHGNTNTNLFLLLLYEVMQHVHTVSDKPIGFRSVISSLQIYNIRRSRTLFFSRFPCRFYRRVLHLLRVLYKAPVLEGVYRRVQNRSCCIPLGPQTGGKSLSSWRN